MKLRPTNPEELARPFGKRLDFEFNNSRGVPMPLQQMTQPCHLFVYLTFAIVVDERRSLDPACRS